MVEWLVVMTAVAANVVMVQVTAAMVVLTMVVVTETMVATAEATEVQRDSVIRGLSVNVNKRPMR